jgi:hypothetical protein
MPAAARPARLSFESGEGERLRGEVAIPPNGYRVSRSSPTAP